MMKNVSSFDSFLPSSFSRQFYAVCRVLLSEVQYARVLMFMLTTDYMYAVSDG
jgi:hypothetical protein